MSCIRISLSLINNNRITKIHKLSIFICINCFWCIYGAFLGQLLFNPSCGKLRTLWLTLVTFLSWLEATFRICCTPRWSPRFRCLNCTPLTNCWRAISMTINQWCWSSSSFITWQNQLQKVALWFRFMRALNGPSTYGIMDGAYDKNDDMWSELSLIVIIRRLKNNKGWSLVQIGQRIKIIENLKSCQNLK